MKKTKLRYLAAIPPVLLLLGWTFISVAPVSADNGHHQTITISGTGNTSGASTLTSTPLNPSCVLLRTFVNTAAATWTGFIATNSPGSSVAHNLANTCVSPSPTAPGLQIVTLNDVTVSCGSGSPTCPAGFSRSGGLVLQGEYAAEGLATSPTGSNTESHITVLSGTGGLEGVTGHGVSMAHVQGTAPTVTSYSNYWIELTFPNSGD